MTGSVGITTDGPVAIIELANAPLNLLTRQLRADLRRTAEEVAAESAIRAVVLKGAGRRSFSAGSDIREFPRTAEAGRVRAVAEHGCYDAIANLPQPVVAGLFGHVLGGGLELALACDIRVADEDARLGLPEVKLGVFPSGAGTQRLPRVVSPSRAKLMMFLGETLDAAQALAVGLVDEVAAPGCAHEAAMSLAHRIAGQPARAVQAIKKAVAHGLEYGTRAGQTMEVELIGELFTSADAKEGVQAFLDSRTPTFTHR
jgi:enoyl-CoA hydratase